jgi:hypothetical protein
LDGSVMVTVYPKEFNVFPPEKVVKRAWRRIGEQMFAFFTNDSSQFSRWCKLKLQKSTSWKDCNCTVRHQTTICIMGNLAFNVVFPNFQYP